jgi:hypothetical protein
MGFFSSLTHNVLNVARGVTRNPLVGSFVPGASVLGLGLNAYSALSPADPNPNQAANLPPLPALGGSASLPVGPFGQNIAVPVPAGYNLSAPGGSSMSFNKVPGIPLPTTTQDFQMLEAAGYWIPAMKTPVMPNPPRGFVWVHWGNGVHGCMRKEMAIKLKLWHPHKKPPISVGEYHALKKAKRAIHKVKKVHGLIHFVNHNTNAHGQVLIGHSAGHKKGHKK